MYAITGESLSLAVTQVMKLLLCVCVTQDTNTHHVAPSIMSRCGLLPCCCPDKMDALSGDVVAYSRFTAQTQCKPHQVTLWLTPLLLPRLNVTLKVSVSLHLSLILQNLLSSSNLWCCGTIT